METDFHTMFRYDTNTGELFNRVRRNARSREFSRVGWVNDSGYLITTIAGKKFRVHHIVWAMHFGCIPDGQEIDHINRVRHDNRIENLRLATRHEQNLNLSKRASKSEVTGVVFNAKDKRWQAQIGFNGKHIYLGQFKEKSSAISARKLAEIRYGFRSVQ